MWATQIWTFQAEDHTSSISSNRVFLNTLKGSYSSYSSYMPNVRLYHIFLNKNLSKWKHVYISYHFFLLITNTHTKVFLPLFLIDVEILGTDPRYMQHIQQAAETLEEFLIQTVSYKQYCHTYFYYNCTYSYFCFL